MELTQDHQRAGLFRTSELCYAPLVIVWMDIKEIDPGLV
jgi:hypothetical protein